jgi:heterodisulfide reductase subunit A
VEPLQRKALTFNHDALVIGGGLAGMSSALELAEQGFNVSLVEREGVLGGNMLKLHYLLSHADPQPMLEKIISQTRHHPKITTFLNAEITSFDGSLGNFQTRLKIRNQAPTQEPQREGTDATPSGTGGIQGVEATINHGVLIVATGAQPYQPCEYVYGKDDRVLTQLELEDRLANHPDEIKNLHAIAMIQCVGSRTPERPYCSRLCCGQAIKNALVIKGINPEIDVYILYRDIRTYGLLEKHYRQARQEGVIFMRVEDKNPPEMSANGGFKLTVHDAMLDEPVSLAPDLLVLSVATVPRTDADDLARMLKVPRTPNGFFQEAHLKLAPVDFAAEGIFLCGMAHYPKKALVESVIQAKAAAGRAATILGQPALEIEPIISHVVEEKCDGCAYCVDPCPFNAISLVEYQSDSGDTKKRVVVDETMCKGCGTCMATCPKDAIHVQHFKLDYLRAMTMAALSVEV